MNRLDSVSASNDGMLMTEWINLLRAAAHDTNWTHQLFDFWAARSPSRPAFHLKFNPCGCFVICLTLSGVCVTLCWVALLSIRALLWDAECCHRREHNLFELIMWQTVKLSLVESQMEVWRGEFLLYKALKNLERFGGSLTDKRLNLAPNCSKTSGL